MKTKLFFAIFLSKLSFYILRLFNKEGGAAPGLIALKIEPGIIRILSSKLEYSVLISGTNGKTTTSRMISSIIKESGYNVIHNRSGSNLLRGIASTIIKHIMLLNSNKKVIGVWEVDEAVVPLALKELTPKLIVLTNLFRDQLDRYGEIDTLAKKWQKAFSKYNKDLTVVLNSDDPRVASLGNKLDKKIVYYGIRDKSLGKQNIEHAADSIFCLDCMTNLKYTKTFFSHLGIYSCPKCKKNQPKPTVYCKKAKIESINKSTLQIVANKSEFEVSIKAPGIYNIYNALAAVSTASSLNIEKEFIIKGLDTFTLPFGRFETVKWGNKKITIILTKNPIALNQSLKTSLLFFKEKQIALMFVLNDLIADGKDVSWIWDANFNYLNQFKNVNKIYLSGRRVDDLQLRIKYSDFEYKKNILQISKDLEKNLKSYKKSSTKHLIIFPTYTAMLETRKILNKWNLTHKRWTE